MCRGDGGLTMSSPPLNIYLSFLLIYYKSRLKKQQPYVLNLRKINTYYVYIKNAINSQISKNIIREDLEFVSQMGFLHVGTM